MVELDLDITGLYYHQEGEVSEDSTILQIMSKYSDESIAKFSAGDRKSFFNYTANSVFLPDGTTSKLFLRRLSVFHSEEPTVRQRTEENEDFASSFPLSPGIYEWDDDLSGTDFPIAFTWQYYLFDAKTSQLLSGLERGRAETNSRRVIPFSSKGSTLKEIATAAGLNGVPEKIRLVWRIVGIFTDKIAAIGLKQAAVVPQDPGDESIIEEARQEAETYKAKVFPK